MLKFLVTSFFMLVLAAPALGKPNVYPVSCDDLWAGVKDTLNNPRDYAIISMDGSGQKVSFIVVGNLTVYTDRIALLPKDGGCTMKETFLEVGADNSDWRQFHHRLDRALAKLQAAKPKATVSSTGQL